MSVHSGKFGIVDGVSTVRNWGIEQVSAAQMFVASNTRGGAGRRAGVKDWSGQYSCYGHSPPVMPGEAFSFEGYTAPDDDRWGGDGLIYYGPAIVGSVALSLNFESSELFNFQTNFSANGALARKSDIIADASTPAVFQPSNARVVLLDPDESVLGSGSGSISTGDEFCVTQVSITFVSALQDVINSCTDSWTERRAGPIDFTGSMTVQDVDPDNFGVEIGDDLILRIYVNATQYWEMKWVHIKDFSGVTADRETGAIMSMGINFEMNGFYDGNDGQIILPGAADPWWPEASS